MVKYVILKNTRTNVPPMINILTCVRDVLFLIPNHRTKRKLIECEPTTFDT